MVVSIDVRLPSVRDSRVARNAVQVATRIWVGKGALLTRGEMVNQIRTRQKRGTGRLSNSVTTRLLSNGFIAGPTVNYALFVDQPTRPHVIRPRRAKALTIPLGGASVGFTRAGQAFTRLPGGRRGDVRFAKSVRHPGTKGMFFVRHTAQAIPGRLTGLLEREVQVQLQRAGAL